MNFNMLSSIMLAIGIKMTMVAKYIIDANWPIIINGYSTGCPPIQVNTSKSATKSQYMNCVSGRKVIARCFDVWSRGRMERMRIDRIRARTPPSLFGIDRRIA